MPPNPFDEANAEVEVDQVAPSGFGLTEQQLTEHTEAEKRRHEERREWALLQNQGWYEWWGLPIPTAVTLPGVGDGNAAEPEVAPDSPEHQMPAGHIIHSVDAVKRGDQISQVDDTRGLKSGMRFLVGTGATQ